MRVLLACCLLAACLATSQPTFDVSLASQAAHLRETGCRDIVDGAARYDRDRVVDVPLFTDEGYPRALKKDSGRVVAVLRLAAPSCSAVDYLMRVLRPDGTLMLSRVVSGASGLDQVEFAADVQGHPDNCLAVQLVTRVGDVVVDLAPDALTTYDTVCDGSVGAVSYR